MPDDDCQPVEWWQHVGLYSRPADYVGHSTSGVYPLLTDGETGLRLDDGTALRIRRLQTTIAEE
jgi:hypothetical protein